MRWWRTAEEAAQHKDAPGFDTCTAHRLPIRGRNREETPIARRRDIRPEEERGAGNEEQRQRQTQKDQGTGTEREREREIPRKIKGYGES